MPPYAGALVPGYTGPGVEAAMRGGALMADKEKPGKAEGPKKQKPGVKLNPGFHQKLKIIADDVGLDMGLLIEQEMEEFVKREWGRIQEKLSQD